MGTVVNFVHLCLFLVLPAVPLHGPWQMLGEFCGSKSKSCLWLLKTPSADRTSWASGEKPGPSA